EGGSAMDLRIDAGAWVLVTFDLGCDGYGFECDDDDPAVQEEGVVACEKNFYHVAERTQWVLVPGTLEQRAEIHTTGELDGWLEDQAVPFDLELALDGDHAVLTGSCSLRAPLR
ncbi:MAG: hypothetical protein KDK70_25610, partial [Myxococcales bacterium]|nr:hypothetical protein [Myxococcales bacterium]